MSRQPMDMGDPRLQDTISACEMGLRRLLHTATAEIFLYACNGHGVWEAVVENLLPPGGLVLLPGTGHFSESWAQQTEALGRRVQRTVWAPGQPIDVAAVAQALRDDTAHHIQAVFAVHTDTCSGVTSDMAALRAAIDSTGHPALLVVDAVASAGVEHLAMDALRANVVLGASQKGLMCPPGLGFVAVDGAAMALCKANPAPRFYWDWVRRQGPMAYQKFCGTPPQNLLAGLQAALALIFTEGLAQVMARHQALAGAVHAAVAAWQLGVPAGGALGFFCTEPAWRSAAVTTITVPAGFDVDAFRDVARERFQVSVAGGLGPLQGRAFRIGHLGDQNAASILGALASVEAALRVVGLPVGPGVQAAVRALSSG